MGALPPGPRTPSLIQTMGWWTGLYWDSWMATRMVLRTVTDLNWAMRSGWH